MTLILSIIDSVNALLLIIWGKVSKTSNVSIKSLYSTISLTALTVIYRRISLIVA